MGFPDIIGHQTINLTFINLANGNVAVKAYGKKPDIIPANPDVAHHLLQLLGEMVGRDEYRMAIPQRFLNFPASGNQDSMILEPGIEFTVGPFCFVDGVIS
jgi:hypothetical protein